MSDRLSHEDELFRRQLRMMVVAAAIFAASVNPVVALAVVLLFKALGV